RQIFTNGSHQKKKLSRLISKLSRMKAHNVMIGMLNEQIHVMPEPLGCLPLPASRSAGSFWPSRSEIIEGTANATLGLIESSPSRSGLGSSMIGRGTGLPANHGAMVNGADGCDHTSSGAQPSSRRTRMNARTTYCASRWPKRGALALLPAA